jgi:hypothetical protein
VDLQMYRLINMCIQFEQWLYFSNIQWDMYISELAYYSYGGISLPLCWEGSLELLGSHVVYVGHEVRHIRPSSEHKRQARHVAGTQ